MSNTQPDLAKLIDQKIVHFTPTQKPIASGTITQVGDGVAQIEGLGDAMMGELLALPQQTQALVLNLNTDTVGAIILGDDKHLKQGDTVTTTGIILSVNASDSIVGRVVDPLGDPLDGKGEIDAGERMPMDRVAPGVLARVPVTVPLQTGIKAIDSMIPIGRGQRELIIGDRSTGKSAIALSTILNQKGNDVICIYVVIGQKRSSVAQTIGILEKHDAMKYTTIVSATASVPASIQYLAPYAGTAIAEYFAAKGKDVLVIYDDLTKHAWAYREVSLLLRRPSGREAYPGDVFYLHSRLLERSARLNEAHGGGSITSLPIVETQAGDVSAYIPTNIISITDGQIFLDADMFNSGQRPAVNLGISVSRVGSTAQIKAMKQVVGSMKVDMAQYRDLAAFAQFSSDLDAVTKAQIERGKRITEILKQNWENPLQVEDQIVVFWAVSNGFIKEVVVENVRQWEADYLEYLHSNHARIFSQILQEKKMTDEIADELKEACEDFNLKHSNLMLRTEE